MRTKIAGFFLAMSLFLFIASCTKKISETSTISEKDLLGSWKNVKGGMGEEIVFSSKEEDYAFAVFVYERVRQTGKWELKNGALSITFDDGSSAAVYKKVTLEKEGLLRFYHQSGEIEQYRKIVPGQRPDEKYLDLEITELLDEIKSNLSETQFSDAFKTQFPWHGDDGQEKEIRGYFMDATVSARNGFEHANALLKEIIEILQLRDFSANDKNTTEIVSAMQKDDLVCRIRLVSSEGDENCTVRIETGFLP
jgi:hypothetical protein